MAITKVPPEAGPKFEGNIPGGKIDDVRQWVSDDEKQ